jgi:50S ribosomal protein L16 3-hydroxylase
MQLLGGLSREEFLKQYWQKKPLLIRQAFPGYQTPISAEEFAGLACEEGVESRLILEKGGDVPWQVRHGPFIESDFTSLPETHWTLLVQSVDHHIPLLARLLDEFNFIPNWRIDDLMVSFAQPQGSVGAHLDNYDVFLLQVQGRRHWYINEDDYTDEDYMVGPEIRILEKFDARQDWVLEPGDMLYLPPGVAHHGVALDDCLTFSIGFRAPTQKELLTAFSDEVDESAKDIFYSDPDLSLQPSPGEIKAEHIEAIRELMFSPKIEKEEFNSWFGSFITESKNDLEYENEELSKDDFILQLKEVGALTRNGNVRFSYIENEKSLSLFVAGEEFSLSNSYLSLAGYLCAHHYVEYNKIVDCCDEDAALDLLFKLYEEGYYFFDE